MAVGGIHLFEAQLGAALAHDQQPQGALEERLPRLGIEEGTASQIEGAGVHGAIAMPAQQEVVPALKLDTDRASFSGAILQFGALRRNARGSGVGEPERFAIPLRMTARGFGRGAIAR